MSGKQARRRRQQAVAAPPPVSRKGARRSASPKVLVIAAVAGLVIAAVIVGIALAVGGNSSSSSSSTTPAIGSLNNALPFAETVQRELKGIPQHGLVLGSPNAPLTMVQYVDLQCPACRAYETSVGEGIVVEVDCARWMQVGGGHMC